MLPMPLPQPDPAQPAATPPGIRHAKLEGIQALRGFAASIVVFHHFAWVVGRFHHDPSSLARFYRLAEVGASGVDIFFCISGLVIARSGWGFGAGARSAWAFACGGLVRVLPLYWLLTSLLVALWAAGLALRELAVTPGLIVASYLLIPYPKADAAGVVTTHPMLDVGWTLTFEMYFYILCTAVIWAAGGRRLFPLALLALIAAALAALLLDPASSLREIALSPMLVEFAFGVLLARWGEQLPLGDRLRRWVARGLIAAGVAGLVASIFLADPAAMRLLVWGVPGAAIVWGAMLSDFDAARSRASRLAMAIGTASYTVYLAHPFATLGLGMILKRGWLQGIDSDLLLMGATIATVLATTATYPLLEGPLLAWGKRLVGRRPG